MPSALTFARDLIETIPIPLIPATNSPWWTARNHSKGKLRNFDHIQLNAFGWHNALLVDLDLPRDGDEMSQSITACLDAEIPPNLIMENPANGHGHALWWLAKPIWRGRDNRTGPGEFADDMTERCRRMVGGDPNYVGLWTKCPVYEGWRLHNLSSRLYDLGDFTQLPRPANSNWRHQVDCETNPEGRHMDLFDRMRMDSYRMVRAYEDRIAWSSAVEELANKYNNYTVPLPYSEVRSLVKSVTDWTWEHRDNFGDGKRRGVMNLSGSSLKLREKQSLGAARTHKVRRETTRNVIRRAREDHPEASQNELAYITNLSRRTVQRYWSSSL